MSLGVASHSLKQEKLGIAKIGIVGLSGTGSYLLYLIAKTPIQEIHLFDGDRFSQHNAFRSPEAATVEELRQEPNKTAYFQNRYAPMRRNIVAHDYFIEESNVEQLCSMDFVFLCLDSGKAKKLILERLEGSRVPFVEVGVGLYLTESSVGGILRVTSSTYESQEPVSHRNRIPSPTAARTTNTTKTSRSPT